MWVQTSDLGSDEARFKRPNTLHSSCVQPLLHLCLLVRGSHLVSQRCHLALEPLLHVCQSLLCLLDLRCCLQTTTNISTLGLASEADDDAPG